MSPSANDTQVGGSHYRRRRVQHWDYACQLPYLDGQVSKYIDRHQEKKGFEDLLKSQHYLIKMMEHYYPREYEEYLEKQRVSVKMVEVAPGMTVHDLNVRNHEFYAGVAGVTVDVAVQPTETVDVVVQPTETVVAANLPARKKRKAAKVVKKKRK